MTTKKKPRVSANMKKVKQLLQEIPEERQPIANALYDELLFMHNTLNTLKAQVENEGAVDMFKQGRQEFLREHPALKAYNVTIQRYSLIYKQLVGLLPETAEEPPADELLDFIEDK